MQMETTIRWGGGGVPVFFLGEGDIAGYVFFSPGFLCAIDLIHVYFY